jgi:hypothetical protein
MRNCTKDEGGPFEFGNKVLISSHSKLPRSKTVLGALRTTRDHSGVQKTGVFCTRTVKNYRSSSMVVNPGNGRGFLYDLSEPSRRRVESTLAIVPVGRLLMRRFGMEPTAESRGSREVGDHRHGASA